MDSYITDRPMAANALPAERVKFIRKTYLHVAGAILAFAGLEAILLRTSIGEEIIQGLFARGGNGPLFVLMLVFIGGGYLAQYWAHAATTKPMQYAGLGLYILLEVAIFLPLLYVADRYFAGQHVIAKAGIMTLTIFLGLTVAVFVSKQDFSFLGPTLGIISFGVLGLILCSWIFGLNLGTWFTFGMIGLAAAYIIYDTSNIIHRYRTDQYVGASLELFASVALMFWYILRLLMSRRD
jgi:FtsH-binding integral membrane protein